MAGEQEEFLTTIGDIGERGDMDGVSESAFLFRAVCLAGAVTGAVTVTTAVGVDIGVAGAVAGVAMSAAVGFSAVYRFGPSASLLGV